MECGRCHSIVNTYSYIKGVYLCEECEKISNPEYFTECKGCGLLNPIDKNNLVKNYDEYEYYENCFKNGGTLKHNTKLDQRKDEDGNIDILELYELITNDMTLYDDDKYSYMNKLIILSYPLTYDMYHNIFSKDYTKERYGAGLMFKIDHVDTNPTHYLYNNFDMEDIKKKTIVGMINVSNIVDCISPVYLQDIRYPSYTILFSDNTSLDVYLDFTDDRDSKEMKRDTDMCRTMSNIVGESSSSSSVPNQNHRCNLKGCEVHRPEQTINVSYHIHPYMLNKKINYIDSNYRDGVLKLEICVRDVDNKINDKSEYTCEDNDKGKDVLRTKACKKYRRFKLLFKNESKHYGYSAKIVVHNK
jgi:hypothetical protein